MGGRLGAPRREAAAVQYRRCASLDEALGLLASGADAKILAGGQSLVPLLNFRMLRPTMLIDINRVSGLAWLREEAGGGCASVR